MADTSPGRSVRRSYFPRILLAGSDVFLADRSGKSFELAPSTASARFSQPVRTESSRAKQVIRRTASP